VSQEGGKRHGSASAKPSPRAASIARYQAGISELTQGARYRRDAPTFDELSSAQL
jgi:hypothetical protein